MIDYPKLIVHECHVLLGLNIHEQPDGSNSGPYIDDFLEYVSLQPGNPWCSAMACWVWHHCGVDDGPKTGSSGAIVKWARDKGRVLDRPIVGCGGILRDPNSSTGYRHTTIVTGVSLFGKVYTCEGNYSNRVVRNVRDNSTLTFIRPW